MMLGRENAFTKAQRWASAQNSPEPAKKVRVVEL